MSQMEQHLDSTLEQILELARWAPSGDNTQRWRFEILDTRRLIVHGRDTRDHCVYDLDGHPSQISLGALLETMAIAASTFGLAMQAARRPEAPEARPTFIMQRFWLTATAQGLQLQPELTPLIFSRYVREGRVFSGTPGMQQRSIRKPLNELLVGPPAEGR